MNKKILLVMCTLAISASCLVTGCTKGDTKADMKADAQTEDTEKKAEEKKEEVIKAELKSIGTKEEGCFEVVLANKTGQDITGVSIRTTDEENFPESLMKEGETFTKEEKRNLYYKAPEQKDKTASTDAADSETKALEPAYEVQITFADKTTKVLHAFPFADMKEGELCFADDVAYLKYSSVKTKEIVETKEAELAVKQQEEADAIAAEEAAAAAEAEVKAKEEEAARAKEAAEAAAQAEAAAKAEAAAAAQQNNNTDYSDDSSYDDYSDDGGDDYSDNTDYGDVGGDAGDDGCLNDGLVY